MKIVVLVPFLACLAACLPTAFSGPRPETLERQREERSADADLSLEKDLQNGEENLSQSAYEFKLDEMEDGGSSYAVAYGRSQHSPTLHSDNHHSLCHFYEHFERVLIRMLEKIRTFLCENGKHTTPFPPYHF